MTGLHPLLAPRMERIASHEPEDAAPAPADVIDLTAAEHAEPPPYVAAAAQAALERGETHYTDRAGILPLREALAARLQTEGIAADAGRLIITNGGSEARFIALQTLVRAGTGMRVLAVGPLQADVRRLLSLLGADVVDLPLRGSRRFRPQMRDIEAALPTVGLVLVADPCPLSGVADAEGTAELLTRAARAGLPVVLDRSAAWQRYDGAAHTLHLTPDANVWVVGSFSDTWALQGWRIGYLLAPSTEVGAPVELKQAMSICTSSVAQQVALAVLDADSDWLDTRRAALRARRDAVLQELAFGGVDLLVPDAWPSLLLHTWAVQPDDRAAAEMLERQARVRVEPATRHGEGLVGWTRIVLGDDERALEGVRRLIGFHLTC